jgi:hypothetical protein
MKEGILTTKSTKDTKGEEEKKEENRKMLSNIGGDNIVYKEMDARDFLSLIIRIAL